MPMTNLLAFACWPGTYCAPVSMAEPSEVLTLVILVVVVTGFVLWLRRRV